jgi:FG-GAP-like repeat
MASSRKAVLSIVVVLLCGIAVGSYAWFNRPPEQTEAEKAQAEAKRYRDTKSADHLIDLKNESLADLENGQFARVDPSLLNLATLSGVEPLGRDWPIERLMVLGTFDPKHDPSVFEEAADRAQTALNLETKLEPKSAMRHYLAAKLAQAQGSATLRVFEQRLAAGTAPGDPVQCCELYQAQLTAGTASDRADSEKTLKALLALVPDNLYAQLEWLGVQARQKTADFSDTLNLVRDLLRPILADRGGAAATRFDRLVEEAQSAAKTAKWTTVDGNVAAIAQLARDLPEVNADRRRIERGISWYLVSDYSHAFYQKHHVDRRLPAAEKPVQFRELELSGPLAQISDAQEARFVDLDLTGRLDIAVLRNESLEIFTRERGDAWTSAASAPLPRGVFNHFLAVDLGGHQPAIDFVLFGPAGVIVIESRAEQNQGKQTRTLQAVTAPAMQLHTKDALLVVALDLDDDGLSDLVVACQVPNSAVATLRVLRNEGSRQFRDITARSGILNLAVGSGSLTAVDWDNDLDVDLIAPGAPTAAQSPSAQSATGQLSTGQSPADIAFFKGRGLARFRSQRFPAKARELQSDAIFTVLDADSNGSWDLLASGPHGMRLLLTSTIEHTRIDTIGVETVSDFAAERVLVLDYDNDGYPDLIAWNKDAVRCFHGSPTGHFERADETLPSELGPISSADFGDVDQDGDSDLIVVKSGPANRAGRVALLRNEGGNANNWIDVRLGGSPPDAKTPDPNRIPPVGLGSTLCLKIRAVSQIQMVQKPATHFGIGRLDAADVLRILWNTGVPTNVLAPAKNTTVTQRPPAAKVKGE